MRRGAGAATPDDAPDLGRGGKARAQKAAAAASKESAARAAAEAAEAAAWEAGADARGRAKSEKALADAAAKAAAKAAAAEQLRKEEAEASAQKLRGAEKVAARRAAKASEEEADRSRASAPSLVARSVDEAIAALTVAASPRAGAGGGGGGNRSDAEEEHADDTDRMGKLASKLAGVDLEDAHPEKRAKAAWARFYERELPVLKAEYKTLRLTQLKDMLWRKWQKSPENPLVAVERAKEATASSWKA